MRVKIFGKCVYSYYIILAIFSVTFIIMLINLPKKYLKWPFFIRVCLVILLLQLLLNLFQNKQRILKSMIMDTGTNRNENGFLNHNTTEYQFLQAKMPFATNGEWQYVGGITTFKMLVYSAFLDARTQPMVRIIAVTRTLKLRNPLPKISCKLWYQEGYRDFRNKTVSAEFKIIKENWNLPYSAYYIVCPLLLTDEIPDAVSVVSDTESTPENILRVIVNYPDKWDPTKLSLTKTVDKMAVCVKPIHYDYNKVFELIEFIELHRILGINHFFLYNHTVGAQVNCLLNNYQKEGIVTVLPWQLPIKSQEEIRTEGIFASLNDCLFRTMHKYSHVIFIDFDEFIIPSKTYDYREMFDGMKEQYPIGKTSCFLFKNAFFYLQWSDDHELSNDLIAKNLRVLKKTRRKSQLHAYRTRSKFIIRPELVNMVGNHFIWEFYNKREYGSFNVDPKEGFLHHYRVCEFGGDDCVNQPSEVDRTAHKYKKPLVKAVKSRYNKHLLECKLENVANTNNSNKSI